MAQSLQNLILILSSVAALSHGDILMTNLDMACPGEGLVYTCVSMGFSQRWTIVNAAIFQPVVKILRKEDILTSYIISEGPHHFNFTLFLTEYESFTSSLSINATESLNGTRIQCASAGSTLIRHISVVTGTPPPPFNLTSSVKEYFDRFYSITLSWAAGQVWVDHYRMTISGGKLQNELTLAHNTTDSIETQSVIITNLPYNVNITASLFAHNCIGSSPAANITFNTGTLYDLETSISVTTFGMYHNESDSYRATTQHYTIFLHYILPVLIGSIITIIILSSVAYVACHRSRISGSTIIECENSEKDPHYEMINPEIHAANMCSEVTSINVDFNDAYVSINSFHTPPKSIILEKSIPPASCSQFP